MIINGIDLVKTQVVAPMLTTKEVFIDRKGRKTSFGLTECGYDIRLAQDIWLFPGRRFVLGSSFEKFRMPHNLMGKLMNKSSWARKGIDVSRTTNIEPGWVGFLTLEITYSKIKPIKLYKGAGIAQVIFEEIKNPAQYSGKYHDQPNRPVEAIF